MKIKFTTSVVQRIGDDVHSYAMNRVYDVDEGHARAYIAAGHAVAAESGGGKVSSTGDEVGGTTRSRRGRRSSQPVGPSEYKEAETEKEPETQTDEA